MPSIVTFIRKNTEDSYGRLGGMTHFKNGVESVLSEWMSYSPAGQVSYFHYGNGINANFGVSASRLQLTSVGYDKPGQTLFSQSYGYVAAGQANDGRIKQIVDNLQPGRNVTYTYDAVQRLKSAVSDGSAFGKPASSVKAPV